LVAKINRKGEKNYNTFGSEMIIIEYRKYLDIDVYFPEYDWTAKNKTYNNFKKGAISCPYEKTVCDVGYIGEGDYKVSENSKHTKGYKAWHRMLQRCYYDKFHERNPTYIGCKVCDEWLNFQNFAEWYEKNYYEVEGETMCLDKDILVKHNKIYSTDTCIYVPQTINLLFTKNNSKRGESVIGTTPFKGKYVVQCHLINPKTGKSKYEYLGRYDTQEKGFEVYKYYKEKNIKEVADYFKNLIPKRLYDGMYSYEVEITD
jgi:hypothetical protein